ncbi:hypothetical protein [Subtercola boreus]|uniref:Uncharacterized protein n=1 Tax=Subtercola boreus TaxID=120213 RepID=A0A3E0WA29_9MICO|nr:hypothetical protein [Subtercola boreus]RFA19339.1 hypothetical protein B7R24_11860 [Subtercola boreus]RFA19600.1 hypothetical protein B7R23_11840 [Subtercola boreus]RFA25965.1 hypothetical protein B7R25_11960 [Subtercola boreus]
MPLLVKSAAPVWALALIGAVVTGLYSSPASFLVFLSVILGGAVILTFVVQLALSRPGGFVDRVSASIAGSLVILAVATLVLTVSQ